MAWNVMESNGMNLAKKNVPNKLMIFGSDRKKRRNSAVCWNKVMSEKNQRLQHRGGGWWK